MEMPSLGLARVALIGPSGRVDGTLMHMHELKLRLLLERMLGLGLRVRVHGRGKAP